MSHTTATNIITRSYSSLSPAATYLLLIRSVTIILMLILHHASHNAAHTGPVKERTGTTAVPSSSSSSFCSACPLFLSLTFSPHSFACLLLLLVLHFLVLLLPADSHSCSLSHHHHYDVLFDHSILICWQRRLQLSLFSSSCARMFVVCVLLLFCCSVVTVLLLQPLLTMEFSST